MDLTPVQFKFKYNTTYFIVVTVALTALVLAELLILWSLLHVFTWKMAVSAFIFALLLSSFFTDLPKTLTANHDGISIKKFIGCARFPISDIIEIRDPDEKTFSVSFIGAGYRSKEHGQPLLSTYLTQKRNILILESKFGHSKLSFAISCPTEESKEQLLKYMSQIREGGEVKLFPKRKLSNN